MQSMETQKPDEALISATMLKQDNAVPGPSGILNPKATCNKTESKELSSEEIKRYPTCAYIPC